MQVIAKNQTAEIISLYIMSGKRVEVPASGQIDLLTQVTREQLSKADDVAFHIKEGNIVINDGAADLTWLQAIDYVRNYRMKVDVQGPATEGGVLITAVTKPDFKEVKIYSHNFADKTTWYADSVREVGEQLSQVSENRFVGDHRYWIDLAHGKVAQEDVINAGNVYSPIICVHNGDGELLDGYVEKDPHDGEGQFEIDYRSGEVVFDDNALPGGDGYVIADYSYATTSTIYVTPTDGKQLDMVRAEAQFTTDIVMKDSISFQLYVYTAVIETALNLPLGTLGPPGSRYPYNAPTVYKSTADFVAEANGNYPVCPAFGGSSWRGMRHPVITLPFDYNALKPLKSSLGAQVRVKLDHDEAHEGTYGTVTFYCHSKDEE